MGRVICRVAVLCALVYGSAFGFVSPVAAASIGVDAANLAASRMGASYVLGTPVRPGPLASSPDSFDCSGLVWWVAGQLGETGFPLVAATQATVGTRLAVSPWSGELPIGALLFLADPGQGPGITHVSIHLGANVAADCYNEDDDCIAHDVSSDNYYFRHWAFATYPWGDTPEYVSGGAGITSAGSGSGAGSDGNIAGAIVAAANGNGVKRAGLVGPIATAQAVNNTVVGAGTTAVASQNPQDVAASHMSGVGGLVGWVKLADSLIPLKGMALLSAVLLVLSLRFALAAGRYIIDLLPG